MKYAAETGGTANPAVHRDEQHIQSTSWRPPIPELIHMLDLCPVEGTLPGLSFHTGGGQLCPSQGVTLLVS